MLFQAVFKKGAFKLKEKWRERFITVIFCVGLFFVCTSFGATGAIFEKIFSILTPVLYGGLVALILNVFMSGISGLIDKLDKKNKIGETLKNIISLITTLLGICLIFYFLIIIIVPRFSEGIQNIIKTVENNWDKIVSFCNNIGLDASKLKELINRFDTASILGFAGKNVKSIIKTVLTTATTLYGGVFTAVISAVCCIYILYGQKKLSSQCSRIIRAYFPQKTANGLINTANLFWETFKSFLGRQCLEALILGTLLTVFMLIFRVPYALIVGCVTAVLALIPYVGAFVSFGAGSVLILLTQPSKLLVFVILFLVIQQIEGNIIYPHIVGKSVGLPAIWTLMAVYAGGELFGIVGMFMFVPIVSVIYTLIKQDVSRRNGQKEEIEILKE